MDKKKKEEEVAKRGGEGYKKVSGGRHHPVGEQLLQCHHEVCGESSCFLYLDFNFSYSYLLKVPKAAFLPHAK